MGLPEGADLPKNHALTQTTAFRARLLVQEANLLVAALYASAVLLGLWATIIVSRLLRAHRGRYELSRNIKRELTRLAKSGDYVQLCNCLYKLRLNRSLQIGNFYDLMHAVNTAKSSKSEMSNTNFLL